MKHHCPAALLDRALARVGSDRASCLVNELYRQIGTLYVQSLRPWAVQFARDTIDAECATRAARRGVNPNGWQRLADLLVLGALGAEPVLAPTVVSPVTDPDQATHPVEGWYEIARQLDLDVGEDIIEYLELSPVAKDKTLIRFIVGRGDIYEELFQALFAEWITSVCQNLDDIPMTGTVTNGT